MPFNSIQRPGIQSRPQTHAAALFNTLWTSAIEVPCEFYSLQNLANGTQDASSIEHSEHAQAIIDALIHSIGARLWRGQPQAVDESELITALEKKLDTLHSTDNQPTAKAIADWALSQIDKLAQNTDIPKLTSFEERAGFDGKATVHGQASGLL